MYPSFVDMYIKPPEQLPGKKNGESLADLEASAKTTPK